MERLAASVGFTKELVSGDAAPVVMAANNEASLKTNSFAACAASN
jgi:hypothetical protein